MRTSARARDPLTPSEITPAKLATSSEHNRLCAKRSMPEQRRLLTVGEAALVLGQSLRCSARQPGCGNRRAGRPRSPAFCLLPTLMRVSCASDGVLRGLTSLSGGGHLSRLRREPAGTAAMWFPCDLLRPLHRHPEASGPVLDREVGGSWWHLPGCPPPQPPASLSRRVRWSKRELRATRVK
jgi:hypothetical protein